MEQNGNAVPQKEFNLPDKDNKKSNTKKNKRYTIEKFIEDNFYCETCPRDIGKKCDCKW